MSLFEPLKLGPFTLKNRVIMAPLVRARSDEQRAPKEIVGTYYAQRASAGLIITEGCHVSDFSTTRSGASAMYTDHQRQAWARVVEKVHAEGGVIFQQLYHVGRRALQSSLPGNAAPIAPTAKPATGGIVLPTGLEPFPVPRAIELDEIPGLINEFQRSAKFALDAGFDGVEIQSAGGFLLDQFLLDGANSREDEYGGTIENRAKFLLQVIDSVSQVFGANRVGIRLSPHFHADGIFDSQYLETYTYVLAELERRGIAYLHLVEGQKRDPDPYRPLYLRLVGPIGSGTVGPGESEPFTAPLFRKLFSGVLIINSGYDGESAAEVVASGAADAVSFGRLFISNPDLPERLRLNAPLIEPDASTFYTSGPEGYIDYPTLVQQTDADLHQLVATTK